MLEQVPTLIRPGAAALGVRWWSLLLARAYAQGPILRRPLLDIVLAWEDPAVVRAFAEAPVALVLGPSRQPFPQAPRCS
jgi:hypothetical protein